MKLHPEDPRLTAYVLGELGAEEAAAVEQAVAADPALLAEITSIRETQQFLADNLAVTGEKLLPAQLEQLRRTARGTSRPAGILTFPAIKEKFQTLLIPLAAAAVLAIATLILLRMPDEPKTTAAASPEKAAETPVPPLESAPAGKPAAPPLSAAGRPGPLSPADSPSVDLPIISRKADLTELAQAIGNGNRTTGQSANLVEMLNNFPLRLNGVAAIAKGAVKPWHPDARGGEAGNHAATLSAELIACPWKPSASLLLIAIRANASNDSTVKLTFHANPETVRTYQVLGFPPAGSEAPADLPDKLPKGTVANIAIEIEPSTPDGSLAYLEWSADGTTAPPITLVRNKDAEPSDDARFAALVCTYGLWRSGERSGIIDADVVSALAREIVSSSLPPDRTSFLNLIDKALRLEHP